MIIARSDVVDFGGGAFTAVIPADLAAVAVALEDGGPDLGSPVWWEPVAAVGAFPSAGHRAPPGTQEPGALAGLL